MAKDSAEDAQRGTEQSVCASNFTQARGALEGKKNPLLKNGFHQSSLRRSQVILFTSDGWERTQPTMGSAIFGSVGLGCRRKVAEHQLGSDVSSVPLRPLLHLSPLGSCLQSLPLLSSMIQIVTNTPIKPFPLQVVGVTEKLGQLLL